MYYFFSFPNLHLFYQFDNHEFNGVQDFKKYILLNPNNGRFNQNLNSVLAQNIDYPKNKNIEVDKNDFFNTNTYFRDLSKLSDFEFFSYLITLLPSFAFLDFDLDENTGLKERLDDFLAVKDLLNFKLDVDLLTKMLNELKAGDDYKINESKIYQELFINFYKYGFASIAKNIKVKSDLGEFKLDFKKVLENYKKEYKVFRSNSSSIPKKIFLAKRYLNNLEESILTSDYNETEKILTDLFNYSKWGFTLEMMSKSFITNIRPIKEIPKKKYYSDLGEIFNYVFLQLYYPGRNKVISPNEIVNLRKKTFNKFY